MTALLSHLKGEFVSILNMSLSESAGPQISEGWLMVVGRFTQPLETPLIILTCRCLPAYEGFHIPTLERQDTYFLFFLLALSST